MMDSHSIFTATDSLKAYYGTKRLKNNRFDELSDDILLHMLMLSSLTMKEVGRTSVLSKRWRYVWSYAPTLNFNSCNISHEISLAKKAWEVDMPRHRYPEPDKFTYVSWVDQVVSSHKALLVNEFRVQCHLQEDSRKSADDWVNFVIKKKVKWLGLDFSSAYGCLQWSHFAFPISSLCKSLTSLELSAINITGGELETFLYNCQVLTFLSLRDSESLVSLQIVSGSLKYLILFYCFKMEFLEISAPKLVYFNYYGPSINVPFKCTPKLTELCIGGYYALDLTNQLMEHSSYLSQLETLCLYFASGIQYMMHSAELPELTRLKKLMIRVRPHSQESILRFKSLITACPLLQKFELQVQHWVNSGEDRRKPCRERTTFPHNHLKIVKILGFDGLLTSLEFTVYLLDIAVSLENIRVDPRVPSKIGSHDEFRSCNVKRVKARRLAKYLRPGIDLVIL